MNYKEQKKLALELFKGDKYKELHQAINDGKCFNVLLPLAEKAGAIEFLDSFVDEWTFKAGRYWNLPEEMLQEAFLKLKGEEWIYYAGESWDIPKEMLQEVFLKLKEEEWIYYAGCDWNIPKDILQTTFLKLKEDKRIYEAGRDWDLPKEMRQEAFLKLKEDKWTFKAGHYWDLPEEMLQETFLKLKEDEWIYKAGRDWDLPKEVSKDVFLKLKDEELICKARQNWKIRKIKAKEKEMKIKHKRFGYVGTVIATQEAFYNIRWDKRPEILFNGGVKESLILKSEVKEVKEVNEDLIWKSRSYDVDFNLDTIKIALLMGASGTVPYVLNAAHKFFNEVSASEVNHMTVPPTAGYTTGGEILTNPIVVCEKLYVEDITWSVTGTLTAAYAVIYKDTGDEATSPLIALFNLDGEKSVSNGSLTIVRFACII